MDRLPFEITSQIIGYLQNFQYAIEASVFTRIDIKSSELEQFAAVFSSRRRRSIPRHLTFRIQLPTYSDEVREDFERHQDRLLNNRVATDWTLRLFTELSLWDADSGVALTLQITAESPADDDYWPKPFGHH
ncbi:hypothetical protein QBC35DRAFT_455285 [Podospora australis]|uniref:F-box domain-containing protein n=1 Tax=Podospora australis TaxID=1536484 RepID=A0AAN7AFY1_9PEZI|nr:hypothetical protein QBC35DRAFT_455285 [Podospora australis]